MSPKIKRSDFSRRRKHGGLRHNRLVNFRTDDMLYEHIARKCHGKVIAEKTRQLWTPSGWELELEKNRLRQRAAGIPDTEFMHPQLLKEMYRKQKRK